MLTSSVEINVNFVYDLLAKIPLVSSPPPPHIVNEVFNPSFLHFAGDGSLYMWGKSSHVIQADQPSSQKVFRPVGIHLNGRSVALVTCGSWHTAAITGKPGLYKKKREENTEELKNQVG